MGSVTNQKRRNQFGDEVDEEKPVTNEEWLIRWDQGKTRFHMPRVHPTLEKFMPELTHGKPAPLRFFLPMCGKSLDLKWLAECGHVVTGVEIAEMGCQQFFQENNIDHEVEMLSAGINGKAYKSTNPKLNITLFCCDFFDLTSEILGGDVDCIWDRGSYAAMHYDFRKRYAPTILNLMNKNTRYLLCTYLFDSETEKFAGPPFCAKEEEVRSLFGASTNIEKVGDRDCITDWQRSWGLDWFRELTYLLILN